MKTNEIKHAIRKTALLATESGQSVEFISTRSPDFILHFTEHREGQPELGQRSIVALNKLTEIKQISERFIPTKATVFLADIALANADDPQNGIPSNFADDLLDSNLKALQLASAKIDPSLGISRLGDIVHPSGKTRRDIVGVDGNGSAFRQLTADAFTHIRAVVKESLEFHQKLGWSERDVEERTTKLAKVMATAGQAFHAQRPRPIMLFMESFVKRAAFNNLLIDRRDPLPIICFNDLRR